MRPWRREIGSTAVAVQSKGIFRATVGGMEEIKPKNIIEEVVLQCH